jgi:hypothetical protein
MRTIWCYVYSLVRHSLIFAWYAGNPAEQHTCHSSEVAYSLRELRKNALLSGNQCIHDGHSDDSKVDVRHLKLLFKLLCSVCEGLLLQSVRKECSTSHLTKGKCTNG